MIVLFDTPEGVAGCAVEEIHWIIPDINRPKTHSVVYTSLLPTGVTVIGDSRELTAMWLSHLVVDADEYVYEEGDEEDDADDEDAHD